MNMLFDLPMWLQIAIANVVAYLTLAFILLLSVRLPKNVSGHLELDPNAWHFKLAFFHGSFLTEVSEKKQLYNKLQKSGYSRCRYVHKLTSMILYGWLIVSALTVVTIVIQYLAVIVWVPCLFLFAKKIDSDAWYPFVSTRHSGLSMNLNYAENIEWLTLPNGLVIKPMYIFGIFVYLWYIISLFTGQVARLYNVSSWIDHPWLNVALTVMTLGTIVIICWLSSLLIVKIWNSIFQSKRKGEFRRSNYSLLLESLKDWHRNNLCPTMFMPSDPQKPEENTTTNSQ